ncbi:MAG: helix-turn-helix domain-containing protein [Candidatus Thalassarchaeaceae archaeon]
MKNWKLTIPTIVVYQGKPAINITAKSRDLMKKPRIKDTQTLERIKRYVCNEFDMTFAQIEGDQRARQLAFPRHIAFFLSRYLSRASLPMIGHFYGDRDHTTVMHGVRRVEQDWPNSHPAWSVKAKRMYDELAAKL